jgi:hypothetical protein
MRAQFHRMALLFFLLVAQSSSAFGNEQADLVDIRGLRSGGDDWQVVGIEESAAGVTVWICQDKWLMYFLHWRPLTPERQELTEDYATDLLLNFWGEDMPFELAGRGGEIVVAGHQGRYIDGTIYDGAIRTRFIIWNCSQTGRQLIADCNINLGLGTPRKLLRKQFEISEHISCHGQPLAEIPNGYRAEHWDQFQLEFYVPSAWRTHEFTSTTWYPDGADIHHGSLWTLPTDSHKFIVLSVKRERQAPDDAMLSSWLKTLEGDNISSNDRVETTVASVARGKVDRKGDVLVARVDVTMASTYQEQTDTDPYSSMAVAWRNGDRNCYLLAGVVSMSEVWKRATDLAPSDTLLLDYMRGEVLPNIRAFPVDFLQWIN